MVKSTRKHILRTPLSIYQWYIFGIYEHKWQTPNHIQDLLCHISNDALCCRVFIDWFSDDKPPVQRQAITWTWYKTTYTEQYID